MRNFLLLSAYAVTVFAEPRVLLEARRGKPIGWKTTGLPVDPTSRLELSFWLTTPKEAVEKMIGALYARSDPRSPLYGQWLSNDQVHDLAAPSNAAHIALKSFLEPFGGIFLLSRLRWWQ